MLPMARQRPNRGCFTAVAMIVARSLPSLVRLEKIAATEVAIFPPGEAATFPYGAGSVATSLPVNYTVIGWMIGAPRVGQPVFLLRVSRNDVHCVGAFRSSCVTVIERDIFRTLNSVYRWRELCVHETDVLRDIDRN